MVQKYLCETCRYYQRYYTFKKAQYVYAHFGYCSHHYMTPRERKSIPNIAECTNWEPQELQITERRETMKKVLRDMRKQLADISAMLKEEEI